MNCAHEKTNEIARIFYPKRWEPFALQGFIFHFEVTRAQNFLEKLGP